MKEKGQSLVELAVTLPLLLLILSGVLDLGRAFFTMVALEDAAGEGALYATFFPECVLADNYDCKGTNNVDWRARNAGGALVDFTKEDTTVTVQCYELYNNVWEEFNCSAGLHNQDKVKVTVENDFNILFPLIPAINTPTIKLASSAIQMVIVDE